MSDASLAELVAAWQVGVAGRREVEELERRLLADPEACRYLARQCRQDVALRRLLGAETVGARHVSPNATPSTAEVSHVPRPGGRPARRSSRVRRVRRPRRARHPGPAPLLVALAATLVVGLIGWALLRSPAPAPAPPPDAAPALAGPRDVAPAPAPPPDAAPGPVPAAPPDAAPAPVFARVESARGATADGTALAAGDRLEEGARVRTAAGGRLVLRMAGDRAVLHGAAEARLRRDRIELAAGAIGIEAAPRRAGDRLAVVTDRAEVLVVGTRFTVRDCVASTEVLVDHGAVRCRRRADGAEVAVPAGHRCLVAPEVELTAAPQQAGVRSFTLIDADRDAPIAGYDPIAPGAVIDLAALPTRNLNLRADVTGVVQAVRFRVDGRPVNLERVPPFALAGDLSRDYNAWKLAPGAHLVEVVAFLDAKATRPLEPDYRLRFTLRDGR